MGSHPVEADLTTPLSHPVPLLLVTAAKGSTSKDAKDKALSRAKREGAGAKKGGKSGGAGAASGGAGDDDDDAKAMELISKYREYRVTFTFTDPAALAPPILSISDMGFR